MNLAYLIPAVVFLVGFVVALLAKAVQLERRLDEKISEKIKLFDENQKLVKENQDLTAANKKWSERVKTAEDARDTARQYSISADSKLVAMRQELNSAQAVARSVEIEVDREKRIKELEAAITKHRAAKGHDRCWLNDLELYKTVGGTIGPNVMPPLPQFMYNCAEYHEGQCRKQTGQEDEDEDEEEDRVEDTALFKEGA